MGPGSCSSQQLLGVHDCNSCRMSSRRFFPQHFPPPSGLYFFHPIFQWRWCLFLKPHKGSTECWLVPPQNINFSLSHSFFSFSSFFLFSFPFFVQHSTRENYFTFENTHPTHIISVSKLFRGESGNSCPPSFSSLCHTRGFYWLFVTLWKCFQSPWFSCCR